MHRFCEIYYSTVLSYFLVKSGESQYQAMLSGLGMTDISWERVISMARSRRHHMFCWSGQRWAITGFYPVDPETETNPENTRPIDTTRD